MVLVDVVLRSSIVVLAALAIAAMLRQRSAAVRHLVLAAGIFGAVAVLPLSHVLPGWDMPLPSSALAGPASEGTTATTAAPEMPMPTRAQTPETWGRQIDLSWTAGVVWAGGAVISLAIMMASAIRLRRLRQRAQRIADGPWLRACEEIATRYGLMQPVALFQTEAAHALGTWGLLRPRVLLPPQASTWSANRARIVLWHELAHIQRGDWLVQVLAELVRAGFWFNPLLWIACAALRRESDHACDDSVLDAGVAAADYATHLVDIARLCRPPSAGWSPAMSMARPSTLERRVAAMLNHRLDRTQPSRRTRIAATALLLFSIAVPSATFRAAQVASTMTGTVYDSTGAVLPQAEVAIQDQQGVRRRASTDSAGQFTFEQVGPGRYAMETTLLGFETVRQNLELQQPRDWTRTITMQVGTLQETISVKAARPTGVVPPGAGRPIGGNIRVPRKILDVRPIYPEAMRDSGLEGEVVLSALIGIDGTVVSAQVVSPQVHPDFANAAIDAVRQWRFSPTLLNGSAIPVSMKVSVQFSLTDEQ